MNTIPCNAQAGFGATAQRGAVLVISLLMLLLLTIIGITAMRTTTMEEKMAGNLRDQNLAFQAGEAALRDAEDTQLQPLTAEPALCTSSPCSSGMWDKDAITDGTDPIDPAYLDSTWWSNASHSHVGPSLSKVPTAPRWVIEYQSLVRDSLVMGHGPPTGRTYYRVTSRATGGTDTAQSVLQSTYAKRFN